MAFDAAIIGLGPSGAVLANLLAKGGMNILVLEKEARAFDRPRAIGIDHESMRILQFCGVAHELAPYTSPFRGTNYVGVDGSVIREVRPASPPYPLGWPPNSSFLQPELERLLRERLATFSNASVLLSHDVERLHFEEDYCHLTVREAATGTVKGLEARYVIGCDGANSIVRRTLNIDYDDLNFNEWWAVVDAWVSDLDRVPPLTQQYCWPSRPVTYVCGPENLRRWELRILPWENPEDFKRPRHVLNALSKYVDTSVVSIWRNAVYRFRAAAAQAWRRENAFIVGDAAHQTPPFMGQGMNSGLRDAANLAWKLLLAERDAIDSRILSTYEQERKPHFAELVSRAVEFGKIIGELDPTAAQERDNRLKHEMTKSNGRFVRQQWIPNLVGGLISREQNGGSQLPAGEIFPQPAIVKGDGECLVDDIYGMRFLLIFASQRYAEGVAPEHLAYLASIGAHVLEIGNFSGLTARGFTGIQLTRQSKYVAEWFKSRGLIAAVVRPDRYVFGGARNVDEVDQLLEELAAAMPLCARPLGGRADQSRDFSIK